jgi:catechol 2,3-dioxygenase-like lactoylglutathione lyase family enzyme
MTPPKIEAVLETGLYVEDMRRAMQFYDNLFGFPKMVWDDRFCAYNVSGRSVLLLFRKKGTLEPMAMPGGILPPHDGEGQQHMAFSIPAAAWDAWLTRLREMQVAVESEVNWERGGRSVYFRDPDGNLLELATPGTWPIY